MTVKSLIRRVPSLLSLSAEVYVASSWHESLTTNEKWEMISMLDRHNVEIKSFPEIVLFFERLMVDELRSSLKPSTISSLFSASKSRLWQFGVNAMSELVYRIHHGESGTLLMETLGGRGVESRRVMNVTPYTVTMVKTKWGEFVATPNLCVIKALYGEKSVLLTVPSGTRCVLDVATEEATREKKALSMRHVEKWLPSESSISMISMYQWIP